MDNVTVAVDDTVERGMPVTLIGGGILAEDLAKQLGTINYEITCGISARVPRRYE
jgi:alanine racemase